MAALFPPRGILGINMTSCLEMATVQEEVICILYFFSRKSPLSKRSLVTGVSMEKIRFEYMLSDADQSSFKRLEVF